MTSPPCGPFVPIQKSSAAAAQGTTRASTAPPMIASPVRCGDVSASLRIMPALRVSTFCARAATTRACDSRRPPDASLGSSNELGDLRQGLLLERRHDGVVGRIADRDQQERPLVLGPAEDLLEEAHRRRGMSQRREPGIVQCDEQNADGDPDRLADVVVLALGAVFLIRPRLLEDRDHVRRFREVRLDPVGPDWLDRLEVLLARSLAVEELLLALGGLADPRLDGGIGDRDERPRLPVRAGRRGRSCANRVLHELARHGLVRELTHRPAAADELQELLATLERRTRGEPREDERPGTELREKHAVHARHEDSPVKLGAARPLPSSADFPHLPPGHAPGTQSLRNRQGLPVLWWIVGLVGLAMFVAGVLVAGHIRRQFPWRDEAIGGTVFASFGLLCLAVAYMQYRKFRPARLRTRFGGVALAVDRDELRPGEAVTATVTHGAVEDLEVGLVCDERFDLIARAQTKAGPVSVRETNEAAAYEDWKPVDAAVGEQVFTFEIPRDAPCSYEGDCLSYGWRVTARQVRRLRTDPRSDRPIWVRP